MRRSCARPFLLRRLHSATSVPTARTSARLTPLWGGSWWLLYIEVISPPTTPANHRDAGTQTEDTEDQVKKTAAPKASQPPKAGPKAGPTAPEPTAPEPSSASEEKGPEVKAAAPKAKPKRRTAKAS